MTTIEQSLAAWKETLLSSIPISGLLSRSPLTYKWKAPFRVWMLREAVAWRLQDLLSQSYELHRLRQGLGARILLRSGFETLATLIYLNQLIAKVLETKIDFFSFSERTSTLLLGTRNTQNGPRSMNIMTVLDNCEKSYPGFSALYADLSESSHPNYEGLCLGYSQPNRDEYETHFSNRWMEMYGDRHIELIETCTHTFHQEYNVVWPSLMEQLEHWIEQHSIELEIMARSRPSHPDGSR